MEIELRHLRSFVAVADELNFTRAAKRLHIVQQALSTQIRQLEERLGAQLLERTTRSVSLTPAGHELYGRAQLLLAGMDDAVAATRASVAATTPITVGFVAAIDHLQVSGAIDRYAATHPEVEVMIRFGDLLDPTGGLGGREADVAMVYGPFDHRGLTLVPLYAEPLGIAMAATHELASRGTLSVKDLVAEPTFDFPTGDAAWRDFWCAAEHRSQPARYVAQYRTLEGLLAALRAGLGVHLATEGLVAHSPEGLVWRRLDDAEPLQYSVAHAEGDDRPMVLDLVDAISAPFQS